jgi:hypothetical protein
MSWEISITAEGWAEIIANLETWNIEELIEAYATAQAYRPVGYLDENRNFIDSDTTPEYIDEVYDRIKDKLTQYPPSHDSLVYSVYDCIQDTKTCDNGGYGYWVDQEGDFKVYLTDKVEG